MEMVILCGLPGAGKSTYCKHKFADTHVRVNLDMLKTRAKERALLEACFASGISFVVDNTNVKAQERKYYLDACEFLSLHKHKKICYFFLPDAISCIVNNLKRENPVPEIAIKAKYKALETPFYEEGFDQIFTVQPIIARGGGIAFRVEEFPIKLGK